jgi:hypothetical protein
MISVFASSAVDHGFEPLSGGTKYYEIGMCGFSANHATLRIKSNDLLFRNQNIASEWDDMAVCGLCVSELAL